MYFDPNNAFTYYEYTGSNYVVTTTNQRFRDPSAWIHVTVAMDTTLSNPSDRTKIYFDGVKNTAFSTATYVPQNHITALNSSGMLAYMGQNGNNGAYLDGYLSDVYFVDGQALTPDAFASTEPTS